VAPVHGADHGGEAGLDLSSGSGRGLNNGQSSRSVITTTFSHAPLTRN
jgi:hypothetical protein